MDAARQEQGGTAQRLRLLSATANIACECGGFESVTLTQLVRRAGMSRHTFYELFDDLEDCFLATFEEAIALARERTVPAYKAQSARTDRVRAGLLALLAFFDEEPELARVCVVYALSAGAQTLARRAKVLEQLTEAVDEEVSRAAGESTKPLPLAAESVVRGVLEAIHMRLLEPNTGRLTDLLNPLMSVIVLPHLGPNAVRGEPARPVPGEGLSTTDPTVATARRERGRRFEGLDIRIGHRMSRVLAAIAAAPGSNNREVAAAAGVQDQGQVSRLLARAQRLGLVRNTGPGVPRGVPNKWTLTPRGIVVEQKRQFEERCSEG